MQFIDFRVRQGPILGAIRNFIGQAFFTFGNRRARVLVKNFNMLDQSVAEILEPIDNFLSRKITVNDNRNVPLDRWKSRQRVGRDSPRSILKQFFEVKFKYVI